MTARPFDSLKRPYPILAGVLLLLLPGCSGVDLATPRLTFEDAPAEPPARMIPVWSDTTLNRPGQQGVRGLGGRIVFYGRQSDEPIEVDGRLILYGWDDTQGNLSQKPDRKYVVSSEDLQRHLSVSSIGSSYSVWLPWDSAGSQHRRVTIVGKFIGKDGAEVISAPQHIVLPGPVPELLSQTQIDAASPLTAGQTTHHRTPGTVGNLDSSHDPGVIQQTGYSSVASSGDIPAAPVSGTPDVQVRLTDVHSGMITRERVRPQDKNLPGLDLRSLDDAGSRLSVSGDHRSVQRSSILTATIPVTPGFASRHFGPGEVIDVDSLELRRTDLEPRRSRIDAGARDGQAVRLSQPDVELKHTAPRFGSQSFQSQSQSATDSRDTADGPRSLTESADRNRSRPGSDYSRSQFRAQMSPEVRPAAGHVRKQPHRATWQRGLPATPRSSPAVE